MLLAVADSFLDSHRHESEKWGLREIRKGKEEEEKEENRTKKEKSW